MISRDESNQDQVCGNQAHPHKARAMPSWVCALHLARLPAEGAQCLEGKTWRTLLPGNLRLLRLEHFAVSPVRLPFDLPLLFTSCLSRGDTGVYFSDHIFMRF